MRLFWKIYLASLCSLLLCTILLTVIVSYRQAEDSLRRLREEQRLLAITAASQVETGYYDQVWPFEMLSEIARDRQFVAWHIVDGSGRVVLSAGTVEEGLAVEGTRPQLVHVAHTDREFWIVPMRMRDGAHPWQFRLGYHTRAIHAQRASIIATNAVIGLGLAIVFIGTSLYVTHRVMRPLKALTQAVSEMERGNLDVSLPETRADELGQLVAGFSAMVGSIKERDAKIQEYLGSLERAHGELEMRVEERTSELHASEARTRAIIQYAADAIITLDDSGRIEVFNPAAARMFGYSSDEAIGRPFSSVLPATYRVRFDQLGIESGEAEVPESIGSSAEINGRRRDGDAFPMHIALSEVVLEGRRMFTAILRDISERKREEAEKQELHQQLVKASRQAGMAEVATSVLHNVGNVLNSVNVSINVVNDRLAKSRVTALAKTASLLHEHHDDLAEFLTVDERGKRLPGYLEKLGASLEEERRSIQSELESVTRDIEHINHVVQGQQSYAKIAVDFRELVSLEELMEDAVRISSSAIADDSIDLVREYEATPRVNIDRHRMVHILVNLVNNAKQAVAGLARDRRIRLCVGPFDAAFVRVAIIDNGVGISRENLACIFNHGFTTKPDGHGFGLHGASLTAKEMGGELTAHSDGVGQGARFSLVLPIGSDGTAASAQASRSMPAASLG
jgi:PAS domain S-box-containing protein